MIRVYQRGIVEVEDGSAINLVDIFFDDDDEANLPTEGIANGSFAFNVGTGELKAFSEGSTAWNDICTIGA